MTSFTPENGTQCNSADSSWVLLYDYGSVNSCYENCSLGCAMMGAMKVFAGANYRPVLYGLSQ